MSNVDLFLSASNVAAKGSRLSAQPLPGSMFSDLVQAPLSSALPSSQAISADLSSGYSLGIKGGILPPAVFSDKVATRGVLLEEGLSPESPQSLTLTADWANI